MTADDTSTDASHQDPASQEDPEREAQIGERVWKIDGYPFDGHIRAIFENSVGLIRVVVELDRPEYSTPKGDMLHIFSPHQLSLYEEDESDPDAWDHPNQVDGR